MRRTLAIAMCAALCAVACKKDDKAGDKKQPETTPESGKPVSGTETEKPAPAAGGCEKTAALPAAADGAEFTDAGVLVAWNRAAEKAAFATAHEGFIDFDNNRGWAMMHIAVHDALNAIRSVYKQYSFTECQPDASPTAAVAQAAHDVLVVVYPTQKEWLDKELETWLGKATKGKEAGVELGKKSAAAILAAREKDGILTDEEKYEPKKPKTGQYQLLKPMAFVHRPQFAKAKSFTLTSNDMFRPEPPPACNTPEYAKAFNEVKELGAKKSKKRNKEQSQWSAWWMQFPLISFNRAAANIQSGEKKLELWPAAQMYALLNIGLQDVLIAVWDAKQHYDYWRPTTAIHSAADDDNKDTAPDPKWEPCFPVPPIQDYPSIHASEVACATEILRTAYGSDDVPIEFESVDALPGAPKTRSFKKLSEAAKEGAESRILIGYHFRFSTEAGLALGEKVGKHVVTTQLQKRE